MKRGYQARRYATGIGEPLAYDRDGQLRERSLTQASARDMVAAMQSLVPDLAQHRVDVLVSLKDHSNKQGQCVTTSPTHHTIYLYIGGHNENVLLHELAHATTPVTKGSGRKHIIHGAAYKNTLMRYERIWRRHSKVRARQVVTAAEPDEITDSAPTRRRTPVCVPTYHYRPTPPKSFHRRLTSWLCALLPLDWITAKIQACINAIGVRRRG